MRRKSNSGFVGIDITISILAIVIFSSLIIALMYNNYVENIKIKRETLATIYLTEAFENIGIASYDEVTQENVDNFIPTELKNEGYYTMQINITSDNNTENLNQEDIVKNVQATISYKIGNKDYQYVIERVKAKE